MKVYNVSNIGLTNRVCRKSVAFGSSQNVQAKVAGQVESRVSVLSERMQQAGNNIVQRANKIPRGIVVLDKPHKSIFDYNKEEYDEMMERLNKIAEEANRDARRNNGMILPGCDMPMI